MNETELIRSILNDDNRNAFAFLVRRYQSSLRGYLMLLCNGHHEFADELAQEVFLKSFRALNTFQGKSKFSTWLFQIARNTFYDAKKQNKINFSESDDIALQTQVNMKIDMKIDLIKALQKLPVEQCETLLLSYIEGFSHDEISEITKVPIGTIKSRILMAKDKLLNELKECKNEA